MKIAHLSDLHCGAKDISEELIADMFAQVVLSGADVLVITGDLTESGIGSEYEMLRAGLVKCQAAGMKILSVPGNHDVAWRGVGSYDDARADAMDDLPSDWSRALWPRLYERIVGLSSSLGQRNELMPHLARGEVGNLQMARLKALGTNRFDVLLLHHHPLWHDRFLLLEDAIQLNKLILGMQFKLVLFGHRHEYFRRKIGYVWYVGAGCTTRERWFEIWDVPTVGQVRVQRRAF